MEKDRAPQVPYQSLAPVYDYVMRHVDYDEWAAFLHSIFLRYSPDARHLIDLACGTGNISTELEKIGYQLTGVDASESMISIAQQKTLIDGNNSDFVHRDIRELEGMGYFDGAVCVYDSLNYLLENNDIADTFSQICSILKPGSLFVFDVCTERNSITYFSDLSDEEQGPGFRYKRRSYYNKENRLQYNEFEIQFDDDETYYHEEHVQRIYPLETIEKEIATSNFTLLGIFDEFTFNTGSEDSNRVHYVVRTPKNK
ncbi:MAG: class I SAM-dependent methyltransferase [Candidatus Latescibacterota bacterium]|nr:class I SAM-dependent methyltransferase [Candidatus Latescibacterota bacterium]